MAYGADGDFQIASRQSIADRCHQPGCYDIGSEHVVDPQLRHSLCPSLVGRELFIP